MPSTRRSAMMAAASPSSSSTTTPAVVRSTILAATTLALVAGLAVVVVVVPTAASATAPAVATTRTWPSPLFDRFEELLYQASGFARFGLIDGVSPCSFSPDGHGRVAAAEWVRTAFHDMITYDVQTGTGGLDGSIRYETDRAENPGDAINATFSFIGGFYNAHTPLSDLIAIALKVSVTSCGGPSIPLRVGRADADRAGPLGVPEPQQSTQEFTAAFAKAGFNTSDMIAMVACGHTLGGVHGEDFPTIVPNGTFDNNFHHFDSTSASFDGKIVTEYVAGNSTDPLVVGPDPDRNADLKVFSADGNATVRALAASPAAFQSACGSILARMIDTVPSTVELSEPIAPYDVKPYSWKLFPNANGNITFSGDVRVRTTVRSDANISAVELLVTDRSGNACESCTIKTFHEMYQGGYGGGDGEQFTYYGFSAMLSQAVSVSRVTVRITLKDGTTEVHDNNGVGFPVQDLVLTDDKKSCRQAPAVSTAPWTGKFVVAVHKSIDINQTPVTLQYWDAIDVGLRIPDLVPGTLSMAPFNTTFATPENNYNYFVASFDTSGAFMSHSTASPVVDGVSDVPRSVGSLIDC
ncbi:L-ascorbate oxidase [Zopfochytrium polystomum]|nr:L-ascorbate oxidase [Zopfochytrium polystomum]